MSRPLTSPEILRGASAIITAHGWCQKKHGAPGGPVCLNGALRLSAGAADPSGYPGHGVPDENVHAFCLAANAIDDLVRAETGDGDMFATQWNDMPGRTRDQVTDVLERAARRMETQP